MPKRRSSPQGIQVNIKGNTTGQIAIGNDITQSQTEGYSSVTPEEMSELLQILKDLRAKVKAMVEPEKKVSALAQVQKLEQTVITKRLDLSKMEKVKNWFGKNVPALAGAVTSVIVHPIVGKLVEAGGDLLVKEFQEKFGGDS